MRCLLAELSLPESEWSNMLCHIEFAINSTVAESVGCSPFELVYGEQVRLTVDAIFGHQSGRSTAVNFVQHI